MRTCAEGGGERECLSAVVGGGSHCTIDFWLYVPATSSNSQTIFNLLSLCNCEGKKVLTELVCAYASRYEVMASRLRQSRAKVTESDVESSSTHFQAP